MPDWQEHKATIKEEAQQSVRTVSAIQAKLDKLDDAFLFQEKIDSETYGGSGIASVRR